MSVVSVKARSFILALFIRDDGERFLLGDNGYEFKDSQLHFAANTIENDEVMKQGADGVIVAGQVRRASVQSFDGFVGDATMAKETIEQMRRDFFAFFVKGHHFRVVYIDCNRNAWQRKGGYLVDAPEVKELWQIHPGYHVGLNFEDVNYYSYDEDSQGEEILSNLVDVPVSTAASGGLVWDEDGAVSEDAEVDYDTETAGATGKAIAISDAAEAPLASFRLDGETSQNGTPTPDAPVAVQTVTGENVVKITGKNLLNAQDTSDRGIVLSYNTSTGEISFSGTPTTTYAIFSLPNIYVGAGTYTISIQSALSFNVGLGFTNASGARTVKAMIAGNTTLSITISEYSKVDLYISGLTSGTAMSAEIFFQLEKGSTATDYEPYQGQSYEVNLGKNLFDVNSITEKTGASTNGAENHEVTYSTNNNRAVTLIKVEPNTQYKLSIGDTSYSSRIYFVGMKSTTLESGHSFSWCASGATLTTNSKDVYLLGAIEATQGGTVSALTNAKIQLEKGSTATSYAPYFAPIELCKIGDYQDYIYKSGGKWYLHKEVGKYQLDGTEVWGTATDGYVLAANSQSPFYNILALGAPSYESLCSHFYFQPNAQTWTGDKKCGFNPTGTFWVMYAAPENKNAFLAWLGQTKPLIYFPLATPTDTEITNEALIEQLEAVLGGHTYAGANNISTITPNEQGTLEVGYYTKYQPMVVGGGYVWEAGGSGGATIVVNNSIDNVNPIWKIYGPTMNPQLENSTTGEVIEYVGLIAEGQTLTIDMGEQTASLDGLNVISNLVGDFVSLAPGANRLIYSVSGDAGASEIGWSEIVG